MPTQMESGAREIRRCGAEKHKGDPVTFDTDVYVCDLPAGHECGHEGGRVGLSTHRLGWMSDASTVPPKARV
jgi:hypothetical protein